MLARIRRIFAKPTASQAAQVLAEHRIAGERAAVKAKARVMRDALGMTRSKALEP